MIDKEANDSEKIYLKEYKEMIKGFAKMAANYPEMTDQLRVALKTSASLMISNRPDSISEFRKLAEEVDAFLQACQTGEIEPSRLVECLDKET